MASTYSALEARRERAREAVSDAMYGGLFESQRQLALDAAEIAIKAATRVTITDEVIEGLAEVAFAGGFETRRALVRVALEALGFEVTE